MVVVLAIILLLTLVALVVGYFVWAALSGPPAEETARRDDRPAVDGVRKQHLKEIDRIRGEDVAADELSPSSWVLAVRA